MTPYGVASMEAEIRVGLPAKISQWNAENITTARALARKILDHADIAEHYNRHPEDRPTE